ASVSGNHGDASRTLLDADFASQRTKRYRGPYLLWQQDHVESRHRITVHDERLRLKYDNRAHNRIKGIEIMETGVYLVYSKAIVEGSIRNSTGYMDHCAHETVVLDHQSLNPRVLLASYITQDESGRARHVHPSHQVGIKAKDTSLQVGLFRFMRQDQIRVRIPLDEDCANTLITSRDFNAAYFGVLKVA
ncbi:hypothetical protein BaRGS_00028305, partial [Batillaria attramentaria]